MKYFLYKSVFDNDTQDIHAACSFEDFAGIIDRSHSHMDRELYPRPSQENKYLCWWELADGHFTVSGYYGRNEFFEDVVKKAMEFEPGIKTFHATSILPFRFSNGLVREVQKIGNKWVPSRRME